MKKRAPRSTLCLSARNRWPLNDIHSHDAFSTQQSSETTGDRAALLPLPIPQRSDLLLSRIEVCPAPSQSLSLTMSLFLCMLVSWLSHRAWPSRGFSSQRWLSLLDLCASSVRRYPSSCVCSCRCRLPPLARPSAVLCGAHWRCCWLLSVTVTAAAAAQPPLAQCRSQRRAQRGGHTNAMRTTDALTRAAALPHHSPRRHPLQLPAQGGTHSAAAARSPPLADSTQSSRVQSEIGESRRGGTTHTDAHCTSRATHSL